MYHVTIATFTASTTSSIARNRPGSRSRNRGKRSSASRSAPRSSGAGEGGGFTPRRFYARKNSGRPKPPAGTPAVAARASGNARGGDHRRDAALELGARDEAVADLRARLA